MRIIARVLGLQAVHRGDEFGEVTVDTGARQTPDALRTAQRLQELLHDPILRLRTLNRCRRNGIDDVIYGTTARKIITGLCKSLQNRKAIRTTEALLRASRLLPNGLNQFHSQPQPTTST